MDDALSLSAGGACIREFLELGDAMKGLLEQYAARRNDNDHALEVIDAFNVLNSDPRQNLTRRELEILELVSDGLRDKEIALKLFLSPSTVKRHTANIYKKLQVGNRREASAMAERLGILPK